MCVCVCVFVYVRVQSSLNNTHKLHLTCTIIKPSRGNLCKTYLMRNLPPFSPFLLHPLHKYYPSPPHIPSPPFPPTTTTINPSFLLSPLPPSLFFSPPKNNNKRTRKKQAVQCYAIKTEEVVIYIFSHLFFSYFLRASGKDSLSKRLGNDCLKAQTPPLCN